MSLALDEIRQRLDSNLRRVEGLVALFGEVGSKSGPTKTDMLRAAVVFLHATLEDVIRSALELRLPRASPTHLDMLQFAVGDTSKEKISIPELAQHRGKTVDDLIRERIDAYLGRSNFNNIPDVLDAVKRMSIDPALLAPYKRDLIAMMNRRHLIVHRADYNRSAGRPGHWKTLRITGKTVTAWTTLVRDLCHTILRELETP